MGIQASKIAQLSGHAMGVYVLAPGNKPETVFSGAGDKFVAEWNLQTLQPEKFSVKMEQTVYALCHIREQHLLLIGDAAGGLHVINLAEKKELRHLVAHQKGLFDIRFNPSNGHVYTLGGDGVFSVWESKDWSLLIQLPLGDFKLRKAALSQDCSQLAVACGDGMVRVFETTFYNETVTIQAHEQGANAVAWHPLKPVLISGGKDAWLRFWNTDSDFKLQLEIPAHNFAIYSIVFSPDGQLCATAGRDKTIKIWKSDFAEKPLRIDRRGFEGHTHSVNALYWSDYESILVSAGDDRSIQFWKVGVTTP